MGDDNRCWATREWESLVFGCDRLPKHDGTHLAEEVWHEDDGAEVRIIMEWP